MGVEMESLIGAGVCLVAVAVGLPSLWPGGQRNWFWGGVGVLGIAGFLALLVWSGWSRRGVPLSYDDFHPGPFFFLALLGLTAGLWLGASRHSPLWALAGAVVGACVGYVLGILSGLWIQALGPVGMFLGFVTYLALIVLVGVDALLIVLSIMHWQR
jgi:hypothetical protein